ncbi:MAG: glycine cleavage system protein H [Deltaproteobacteria bacterium]|nr:MAG: glycine cleavage system protein H [Deltaproteobacteria bacterium]
MKAPRRETAPDRAGAATGAAPVCVWMSAGVLSYWLCPRAFDCDSCVLDRILSGRDPLGPPSEERCDGDVVLHTDNATFAPLAVPPRRRRGLFYHPLHLWGRAVGQDRVRLGLDDLAARLLASADSWVLPSVGTAVTDGHTLAQARVGAVTVHISAPVSGCVLARNDALRRHPVLAAWAPYEAGWLVELGTDVPLGPLSGFMHDEAMVKSWFDRELDRLATFAAHDEVVGETLADGGLPCASLRDILGERGLTRALAQVFPSVGRVSSRR